MLRIGVGIVGAHGLFLGSIGGAIAARGRSTDSWSLFVPAQDDGPQPPIPAPRGVPQARELLILVAATMFALGGALVWALSPGSSDSRRPANTLTSRDGGRAASFVGAKACAECHAGEYAHYTRSGHAHTLRLAAQTPRSRWLAGKKIVDPENPFVVWSYALDGERLTADRGVEGNNETQRQVLDYAFGSRSMSFVSVLPGDPRHPASQEHRLSYFASLDAMQVTPGQRQPSPDSGTSQIGRFRDPEDTLLCFACHATLTSSRGNGEIDSKTLVPNVSCERCHGPGRAHVEAARRGDSELAMLLGPRHGWTSEELIRSCGQCHRLPEMAPAGSVRADNHALVRFQPIGLLNSVCYQKSKGGLSCVTCHDPHARASTDDRYYEKSCVNCHQDSAKQVVCSVSPREGCVACHMPKREVVRGASFTDHWILRKPD
jgi:hypothetical protein